MAGNTLGKLYTLTSFGESHGKALGGIIDGCPAGIEISHEKIQYQLDKRRPGQSSVTTSRNEKDLVEILSGIFEGKTTGMPIAFMVYNQDNKVHDYDEIKKIHRPAHADFTWENKFGIHDYRGGGRSSAREHIGRVVGGAIAMQVLEKIGVRIFAYTSKVGDIQIDQPVDQISYENIQTNEIFCPQPEKSELIKQLLINCKQNGDSVGAISSCIIKGVPIGIGEPVFDRLQARLAYYMMNINAAKGFEYGQGFKAAEMSGSIHNDTYTLSSGVTKPATNLAGGILGGVSTGEDIYFNVAFKPIATISKPQNTVNKKGETIQFSATGRHDPCVIPRVIPVIESMAAMAILDLTLEAGLIPRVF